MELLAPYLLSRKASSAARASLQKIETGTRYLASQGPLPTARVNTARIAWATLPAGGCHLDDGDRMPPRVGSWWELLGSNQRLPACRAGTLPTELSSQKQHSQAGAWLRELVGRVGFEPTTSGLTYHFDFRRQNPGALFVVWTIPSPFIRRWAGG